MTITAEQLLSGESARHEVEIPAELLPSDAVPLNPTLTVRPLTVRDLQLISSAVRDDETLTAALMIQQAIVDPPLRVELVKQMPAGLARFLVERINAISGITTPGHALEELVQAPLAKACFVLAKEFGWTPEQVSGMTIGQILMYLEMAHGDVEAT